MHEHATASTPDCLHYCGDLSRHAAIPGRVAFRPSPMGPLAILASPRGTATVALLGAQTMSWCPANGEEVLFWPSSPLSAPSPGEEIHGGLPICWPWFGRMGPPGSGPHGLARYCRFAVEKTSASAERTELLLSLVPPSNGLPGFPHAFRLDVRISVGTVLELSFRATNEGKDAFPVTAGFHPYLRVSDAAAVLLDGFDGTPYLDWHANADGQEPHDIQSGAYHPAPGSRVFVIPRPSCCLRDPGLHRMLHLEAKGHSRCCVWRSPPIPEDTSRNNLRPVDVHSFVCVEPVVFPRCDAINLQPGEFHEMHLVLRSEPMP